MARRVKGFPEGSQRRGNKNYDWEKWFDGKVWKLDQGKDFTTKVSSMRALASYQAKSRGFKIQTKVAGESIYLQTYKESTEGEG